MKKILALIFVFSLIIPQITNAAWYNPISWFSGWFQHKPDQVEVLRKKIAELESKIGTTTPAAPIAPVLPKPQSKPVVSVPVVDTEALMQQQILEAKLKAEAQLKADQESAAANAARVQAINDQKARDVEARAQAAREANAQNDINAKYDAKRAKLDALNYKIAQLNAKYAADVDVVYATTGISSSAVDGMINALNRTYQADYNRLKAEYQLVQTEP